MRGKINFDRDEFPDTREMALTWWNARLRDQPGGKEAWNTWHKHCTKLQGIQNLEIRQSSGESSSWADYNAHELLDDTALKACSWNKQNQDLKKDTLAKRRQVLDLAAEHGLPAVRPYYAVLVADGDEMGTYLSGEKGPSFEQAYHPRMLSHLKELGVPAENLTGTRPLDPAAQLAFSKCLNEFTRRAPVHIEEQFGRCIYAGGDDVLALLPVQTCLLAAAELARLFRRESEGGSLSAGIAIVHCQEDLRMAIACARAAEATAKREGRNGLCLITRPRSGAERSAYCPWLFQKNDQENHRCLIEDWQNIAALLAGQSGRWVHHLDAERAVLRDLPLEAIWQRCRHHLLHGEEGSKQHQSDLGSLLGSLSEAWAETNTGLKSRAGYRRREKEGSGPDAWLADQFIDWCLHAEWLARFHAPACRLEGADS